MEIRGAGADSADARPPDHGRRLRAVRVGGDDGDRRRPADDRRLLALRHDHRVRPHPRERAADAAGRVLADHQPLDERSADALAGDVAVDAAADPLRCCSSAARRSRTSPSRWRSASSPARTRRSSSPPRCSCTGRRASAVWRARRRRVAAANGGDVPAYATAAGGAATEVEIEESGAAPPPDRARRPEPERQPEGVRRDGPRPARGAGAHGHRRGAKRRRHRRLPPPQDDARDLSPEDLVLKDDPTRKPKRPRNKRHGRR